MSVSTQIFAVLASAKYFERLNVELENPHERGCTRDSGISGSVEYPITDFPARTSETKTEIRATGIPVTALI